MMTIRKALTIAGSDTSGGAGIQADLKTFQESGVYGMTVLTTIVAMSPKDWSHSVFPVSLEAFDAQLETVFDSIGTDALKTGMLGSTDIIERTADRIVRHQARNVVVDPVMICKGTDEVLHPETAVALREVLVPKATIVTPNLFEASQLSKRPAITTVEQMKEAAAIIHESGVKYVLIKGGGKLPGERAVDLLYDGITFELYESEKLVTTNTHGAGCTYSAAITAELAKGRDVKEAVMIAKSFITNAIKHSFPINSFVGPTLHAAERLYGSAAISK